VACRAFAVAVAENSAVAVAATWVAAALEAVAVALAFAALCDAPAVAVAAACADAEREPEIANTTRRTMTSPAATPRMTRLMSACLRVEAKGKYGKERSVDCSAGAGDVRRGEEGASSPMGEFVVALGRFVGALGGLIGAVGGSGVAPKV
jgi:hypothetical protein